MSRRFTVPTIRNTKLRDGRPGRRTDDGFTLIELVIITLLIGVLVAIALTLMLGQKNKAASAAAKHEVGASGSMMGTNKGISGARMLANCEDYADIGR